MSAASGERGRSKSAALQPLVEKVAGLLADCSEDGWDSYGARGLTPAAVEAFARSLANSLFPTVNGGLMLEWDSTDHGPAGRSGLIIEWTADGNIDGFCANNGTAEVEWEAAANGREVAQ